MTSNSVSQELSKTEKLNGAKLKNIFKNLKIYFHAIYNQHEEI